MDQFIIELSKYIFAIISFLFLLESWTKYNKIRHLDCESPAGIKIEIYYAFTPKCALVAPPRLPALRSGFHAPA